MSVHDPSGEGSNSGGRFRLQLPTCAVPIDGSVQAWDQPVEMLSFLPAAPDPNPMFLQKRVYQGSSGEVYPLPFIDSIATTGVLKSWHAIHLENQYLRLMILPQIGGRIHVGLDKTNGYDFFYRQNVIKPALVGLAGPWISGGVEFNWPQHHRPATFLPVDTEIERHDDGSVTVWCSDYDRATRMKGMHGICLHPDRAIVELKARLYNGTPNVQSFLWWANVGVRVHEHYQSFFPSDVRYVADHAKRAVSSFPLAEGRYYGVDYGDRAQHGVPEDEMPAHFLPGGYAPNDLSRYANIPVPTSYMVVQTEEDFFGGYDHAAHAGFIHVANHHIAPGKKQWTWGNHEFGYAWDRCLTEDDGPYIELMAGVYTDNQPDFAFLAPGETKTFNQFWYPLRNTGIPIAANLSAAARLTVEDNKAQISLCVTKTLPSAEVLLKYGSDVLEQWKQPVTVETGFTATSLLPAQCDPSQLRLELKNEAETILETSLKARAEKPAPAMAVEPPLPEDIESLDQLFFIGLHLEQYHHATRAPETYWLEALRRDAGDSRCNHALSKLYLKRGECTLAEGYVRSAIARATHLNPNPYDGEIYYTLGLILRHQQRDDEAYAAFYKAAWNAAWSAAAYHALAQIDVRRGDDATAWQQLQRSLRTNTEDLNARNLAVMVLRRLRNHEAAHSMLSETRAKDKLDLWSRYLGGDTLPLRGHALLELGLMLERCGLYKDARTVLHQAIAAPQDGSMPLVCIALARCCDAMCDAGCESYLEAAATASSLYCFPSGVEHQSLLEYAILKRPDVANFHYYLGNLRYHHRRHEAAIQSWEETVRLRPAFAQAWRNLGVAYYNVRHDRTAAQHAFNQAFAFSPEDARLFYERDQLQKRVGVDPAQRLRGFQMQPRIVELRDDLSVELATLLNQLERPKESLDVLLHRHFQPWEGGEGLVLAQYCRVLRKLGQQFLEKGRPEEAVEYLKRAMHPPSTLGEAKHLLANDSDLYFWLGESLAAKGDSAAAREAYLRCAAQSGDFQGMSVQPFSEMTFWSGLALQRLGRENDAAELFRRLEAYASALETQPAKIDYFATSLPSLLLFEEDIDERQKLRAKLLRAAAGIGHGDYAAGRILMEEVLRDEPQCLFATDVLQFSAAREFPAMLNGA